MPGYTPLFSTLTTGTLCGRWPDIGLWPIVLSLCDWRGHVDVTPQYLANVTGLPIAEVISCMKRFCDPDPFSRSNTESGARLVLLEAHRDWGWKVVNLELYRAKVNDIEQVNDGRNALKVKRYKDKLKRTPGDTGRHRRTPEDTARHRETLYSDTDSDSDKNKNKISIPTESHSSCDQLEPVDLVFNHWKSVWNHPRAALDPKRDAKIKLALKHYPAEVLCEAISGYKNSPHHLGHNDRNTVFDDIGLLLRDAAHIDAGLAFAQSPPQLTSAVTQHNVAVLQNWEPPEVRHANSGQEPIPSGDGEHRRRIHARHFTADD